MLKTAALFATAPTPCGAMTEKHAKVDASTACEWCEKILEDAHKGIQHLANNEVRILGKCAASAGWTLGFDHRI